MPHRVNLLDPPLLAGAFIICVLLGPLGLPLSGVGLAQALRARHVWGILAFGAAVAWGVLVLAPLLMALAGHPVISVESG